MHPVMARAQARQVGEVVTAAVFAVDDVVDLDEPRPAPRHPTPPVPAHHVAAHDRRDRLDRGGDAHRAALAFPLGGDRAVTTGQAAQPLRHVTALVISRRAVGVDVDMDPVAVPPRRVAHAVQAPLGHLHQRVHQRDRVPVTLEQRVFRLAEGGVEDPAVVGIQPGRQPPRPVIIGIQRQRLHHRRLHRHRHRRVHGWVGGDVLGERVAGGHLAQLGHRRVAGQAGGFLLGPPRHLRRDRGHLVHRQLPGGERRHRGRQLAAPRRDLHHRTGMRRRQAGLPRHPVGRVWIPHCTHASASRASPTRATRRALSTFSCPHTSASSASRASSRPCGSPSTTPDTMPESYICSHPDPTSPHEESPLSENPDPSPRTRRALRRRRTLRAPSGSLFSAASARVSRLWLRPRNRCVARRERR
jgi:hypothetical protein